MDPKDFELKFREFMGRELPNQSFQAVIAYTDGIKDEGKMEVKTQVIGFDPNNTPFTVAHALFKSLEAAIGAMLAGVYGANMRAENPRGKEESGSSMHR